jgi:hypothetical protein
MKVKLKESRPVFPRLSTQRVLMTLCVSVTPHTARPKLLTIFINMEMVAAQSYK